MCTFDERLLILFFGCWGMRLLPFSPMDHRESRSEWVLYNDDGSYYFNSLNETTKWTSRLLSAAKMNETAYLIVQAYLKGDEREKSLIIDWVHSEGDGCWGSEGYKTSVEELKTDISVNNFYELTRDNKLNKIKYGIYKEKSTRILPHFDLKSVNHAGYQWILRRIRIAEFLQLEKSVPEALSKRRDQMRL